MFLFLDRGHFMVLFKLGYCSHCRLVACVELQVFRIDSILADQCNFEGLCQQESDPGPRQEEHLCLEEMLLEVTSFTLLLLPRLSLFQAPFPFCKITMFGVLDLPLSAPCLECMESHSCRYFGALEHPWVVEFVHRRQWDEWKQHMPCL
jgi:hypothetical protein